MGQMAPTSIVGSSNVAPIEMSLDKGKGIVGSVPFEALKEEQLLLLPLRESRQMGTWVRGSSEDGTSNLYRLECPRFDGTDFHRWWLKLEQFFSSECVRHEAKGSVTQFHDTFVSLLNQIDLTEEHAISVFVSNLKPEIGQSLQLLPPSTLVDGFRLARRVGVLFQGL
ncbi:hypothetical protein J1N35_010552 [Gossypium stocksii]|uniref:Retrotransposon gag domain-containing protein n=1 Tax=Gossypium stocksii TaxID=47602 RepID=A0A9D4AC59_9ROSI|nr:hypothetical protein J1N35_010552 [Gossypium stocksii]